MSLASIGPSQKQFACGLTGVTLPIPESGKGLQDHLAEIRWELEWLLTMQYSATDGRVSHKLTSLKFDATTTWVMPEGTPRPDSSCPSGRPPQQISLEDGQDSSYLQAL